VLARPHPLPGLALSDFQKTNFDAGRCTFVAVAKLRSFSAAAEMLHKTTSAILHIKTLEESVGTPLFKRTTGRVKLTPAARFCPRKRARSSSGCKPCPTS
jgi:LysR family transcriptional activator of the allD operon